MSSHQGGLSSGVSTVLQYMQQCLVLCVSLTTTVAIFFSTTMYTAMLSSLYFTDDYCCYFFSASMYTAVLSSLYFTDNYCCYFFQRTKTVGRMMLMFPIVPPSRKTHRTSLTPKPSVALQRKRRKQNKANCMTMSTETDSPRKKKKKRKKKLQSTISH